MLDQLPQLIPSELCLVCPVCCRFPEKQADLSPFFFSEERDRVERLCGSGSNDKHFRKEGPSKAELTPCGHGFACSFFEPSDHTCRIYVVRPLDCQIYPVIVMRDRDRRGVYIGADHKCPALSRPEIASRIEGHVETVRRFLEEPAMAAKILAHPEFIGEYQQEADQLMELSLERV